MQRMVCQVLNAILQFSKRNTERKHTMGMKDKGGRAFSSGNEFMSSGMNEKHKPKGLPPKNKARALTHRASKCVRITLTENLPMDGDLLVNDPDMQRANHLMGWA